MDGPVMLTWSVVGSRHNRGGRITAPRLEGPARAKKYVLTAFGLRLVWPV